MSNVINILHKTNKTIFSANDLRLLWSISNKDLLKSRIQYYVSKGDLIRITKGMYALDDSYSPGELAASIYTPAYLSFETVLREAGVIFQNYERIFVASYISREITIRATKIVFKKLKPAILVNPFGIIQEANLAKATPERAIFDSLYLNPNFYFDNLRQVNWKLLGKMAKIYESQTVLNKAKEIRKY